MLSKMNLILIAVAMVSLRKVHSAAIEAAKPVRCARVETEGSEYAKEKAKLNGIAKERVHDKWKGNESILCNAGIQHCYILWSIDVSNASDSLVLKKGCWDFPNTDECLTSSCVPSDTANHGHRIGGRLNTRFCCCHGDMCNERIGQEPPPPPIVRSLVPSRKLPSSSSNYVIAASEPDVLDIDPYYREKTVAIALSSVTGVAIAIVVAYYLYRKLSEPKCDNVDEVAFLEAVSARGGGSGLGSDGVGAFDGSDLQLDFLLTSGRFGEVWRGTLDKNVVAVKVFSVALKQYYDNERAVYTLPLLDHDALPKFFGSGQWAKPQGTQYFIVMSYMPHGSLLDYLRKNTLDFATLHRMCRSLASALSHLHTDYHSGGWRKPAVVHRDINSRNILVRDDLSCCLCDFGASMQVRVNTIIVSSGAEIDVKLARLTDVGTVRYMPPEVLDCAVDIQNCESALKQVDVYATGLVLWEAATRCSDFFVAGQMPVAHQLPFEAEVGQKPSAEQMKMVVCVQRKRPAFPSNWKDNEAISMFKLTVEECWDAEAEARLASPCLVDRLDYIRALWDCNDDSEVQSRADLDGNEKATSSDCVFESANDEEEQESCESTTLVCHDDNQPNGDVQQLLSQKVTAEVVSPSMVTIVQHRKKSGGQRRSRVKSAGSTSLPVSSEVRVVAGRERSLDVASLAAVDEGYGTATRSSSRSRSHSYVELGRKSRSGDADERRRHQQAKVRRPDSLLVQGQGRRSVNVANSNQLPVHV